MRYDAFVRELIRRGHDVEVVTAMPNYPIGRIFPDYRGRFYAREEHHGATVHRVWAYAALGSGWRRFWNYTSFAISCLYGLMQCRKPDYLFVELPPPLMSVPGWLAAAVWRRPLLVNVADAWPDSLIDLGLLRSRIAIGFFRWLEGWSYRRAKYVTAVTDGIYDNLRGVKNVPPTKMFMLPNGVDASLFAPRQRDCALVRELSVGEKTVFAYTGTIGYAQGLYVLLEAMAGLRDSGDNSCMAIFLGDGSERASLSSSAKELGLENVRFVPPHPTDYVVGLYSAARAGLVCLRGKSIFDHARPAKLLAIMACGRAVIYSGTGEGAEIVRRADAGLTVPPEDAGALADAIRTLANDKELAERFGRNGRRYVVEHLTWERVVGDWLEQLGKAESWDSLQERNSSDTAGDAGAARPRTSDEQISMKGSRS